MGDIDGLAVQQVTRIIRVTPEEQAVIEISEVHCSGNFLKAQILPKTTDDPAICIQVTFDASRFTRSEALNGSVTFSTNSKRVPKAIVYVHSKYNAPAQVDPKTVVIESSEQGEVKRNLRITTSPTARVRSVRSGSENGVRIEFDNQRTARDHILRAFARPCQEKPLDCELEIEVELLTDGKGNTVRTLRVPFYRFS